MLVLFALLLCLKFEMAGCCCGEYLRGLECLKNRMCFFFMVLAVFIKILRFCNSSLVFVVQNLRNFKKSITSHTPLKHKVNMTGRSAMTKNHNSTWFCFWIIFLTTAGYAVVDVILTIQTVWYIISQWMTTLRYEVVNIWVLCIICLQNSCQFFKRGQCMYL